MAQIFPAQTSGVLPRTQRPVVPHKQLSKEEWRALEPFVRLQYAHSTLKSVMKSIEREYKFVPTRRQMTRKLTEWGIEKKVKQIEKRGTAHKKCTSKGRVPWIHSSRLDTVENERLQRSIPREEAGSNQVTVHAQNQYSSVIDDNNFVRLDLSSSASSKITTSTVANDFTISYGKTHSAQNALAPLSPSDTSLFFMEWEELEPDVEIIPRTILEDAWPFNKRASDDASGSLDLSQLFEHLDLETKDLPSVESLLTSWNSSMHLNPTIEDICITSTELTLISRGEDLPHFSADIRTIQCVKQYDQEYSAFPFKGRVVHIDFPSGHAMNPCPFNEVYPFPTTAPQKTRVDRRSPSSRIARQIKIEQFENGLDELKQASDETDTQVLKGMESLAILYYSHGEYSKAEQLYEKIVATLKKINGADKVRIFDRSLDLIGCLKDQDRTKEAYEMHESVHKEIWATFAPENEISIRSLKGKAYIGAGLKLSEMHETACRQLVQITLNAYGTKHAQTKEALAHLGNYLRIRRENSESERLLATAVELGNAYAHDAYDQNCENMKFLARTLWKQDRDQEALSLLHKSTHMAVSHLGIEHQETIESYYWTGMILQGRNELEESETMLRKALDFWIQVNGESYHWTLRAMASLGRTLRKRGNLKEAIELLQKALPGLMQVFGPAHKHTIICCLQLAVCFKAQGHWDLALAQYQWLAGEIRSAEGDNHADIKEIQEWIDEAKDEIAAMEELISYDDSESESSEEVDTVSGNDRYSEEEADDAVSFAEEDSTVDEQSSKVNQDVSITEEFHMDLDDDSQFQGIDMSTPKWP